MHTLQGRLWMLGDDVNTSLLKACIVKLSAAWNSALYTWGIKMYIWEAVHTLRQGIFP